MKKLELFVLYVKLSLLFYEAVQLGLKEKEPKLYEEELKTLKQVQKTIVVLSTL
jgi:hypothetical protein